MYRAPRKTPAEWRAASKRFLEVMRRRRVKPSPEMVVRFMAAMGEKDTIVRHPEVIESLVAAGRDPIASAAGLAENRAIGSPVGFRPSLRVHPDDLRSLTAPTLVIWVTTTP